MNTIGESSRGNQEARLAPDADRSLPTHRLIRRIVLTLLALGIWFWTQSLLAQRALPASGIGDALHLWTSGLNAYFNRSPAAANALLIGSSALIDAIGLFLLLRWFFGPSVRPFLGLVMLLSLRQILQALCALPAPPGMIWHYPGFPSALVTYKVENDFFFSGHTAIAVFGAMELARLGKRWLTTLAILVAAFEIAAVIVLRAHYTMDVFTGLLAAICVGQFCSRVSPRLDRWLTLRYS